MAKITKHGGTSYEPTPEIRIRRAEIGGESKSDGTNSETSEKKQPTSDARNGQPLPKRAPTTDSPSSKEKADSTAPLMDGDQAARAKRLTKQPRKSTHIQDDDLEFD